MTELERRALLGDKTAQEECTEKGIVLPFPFCGSKAERGVNKRDSRKRFGVYHTIATIQCKICTAKVTMAGTSIESAYKNAERHWNDRAAPPIGHCIDCANVCEVGDNLVTCDIFERDMMPDDFCSQFEAKEGEHIGMDKR